MKIETYIDSDGQRLRVEINSNGTKWYINSNDKIHRLDGPAIEHSDGDYSYLKNGKWHRIGGPARYYNDENFISKSWYINNKQVEIYYICG